jgi:hypothetical protein
MDVGRDCYGAKQHVAQWPEHRAGGGTMGQLAPFGVKRQLTPSVWSESYQLRLNSRFQAVSFYPVCWVGVLAVISQNKLPCDWPE